MSTLNLTAETVDVVFQTPGPHPNGVQATAEGLWLLDQETNRAYLVDYAGNLLRDLPTESDRGSGITVDGQSLWLASTYSCELLRVDINTGATQARYPAPGAQKTGSHGLEIRDGLLWVTTPPAATVYQLDLHNDLALRHSFPAPGHRPHGLAFNGDDFWIVETNDRAFYCLDTQSGDVRAKLTLPDDAPEPHGMSIWQGVFWYCDATTHAVCRLPVPSLNG